MKLNKLLLSTFASLITFVFLPGVAAVSNSEIIYKSDVVDFSDCGINLAERSGEFKEISIMNLQTGDVFVDVDEAAKKIISISRSAKKIIIDTQTPGLYEAIESYRLPEQNIRIEIGDELADNRGSKNILSKGFTIKKNYSNKAGKVSFETDLHATLDIDANIDIPIKKKKGLVKVGSGFKITMNSAKIEADISKKYDSKEIKLVDVDKKMSGLKIKTKIITQTIASGEINAQLNMSGNISGGVAFSSILERKKLLPMPTKCGVTRDFNVDMKENLVLSVPKSTSLEQLFGLEFSLSILKIDLADVKTKAEPYFKASGKVDTSLSFGVDKNFKVTVTPPTNRLSAECEVGINMDTSLSLVKNLYKKDFGEKNIVVYRCAGNK